MSDGALPSLRPDSAERPDPQDRYDAAMREFRAYADEASRERLLERHRALWRHRNGSTVGLASVTQQLDDWAAGEIKARELRERTA